MSFTPGAGTRFLLFGSQPLSGGTISGNSSASFLDISGTWNTTGTPTGIRLNVTDTASNAASLLMDLQRGGVTQLSVNKLGTIFSRTNGATDVLTTLGGTRLNDYASYFSFNNSVASTVGFSFITSVGATADLLIVRDAANTLAQRNGVNSQTLRVYNTFTDASNYERGFLNWSANALRIGTEGLGTGAGTNLHLDFVVTGTQRFRIPAGSGTIAIEGFNSASNSTYFLLKNTGGDLFFGKDSAGGGAFGGAYEGAIWMSGAQNFVLHSNGAVRFVVPPLGGFVVGPRAGVNGALATNATDGFLYVPGCAGLPTGTPSAWTGRVPIVVDTTNNKLYFYSGGAWRDAGP